MSTTVPATDQTSTLADQILTRIEHLILESERDNRPLEVDPYRARLFELFVTAHGAGYLDEHASVDLSADELCRLLSERWGLKTAAEASVREKQRLPTEHLTRMRGLWSMMRMWMEWSYAWQRWDEFHSRP